MSTPELAPHRRQQGGPPLGVLAVVSTVLFLLALFVAGVVVKGFPPAPTAAAATIQRYFHGHRSAAWVSALFRGRQ